MNIYENLGNDRKNIEEKNRKQRLEIWTLWLTYLSPLWRFLLDAKLFIWTTQIQKYCPQNLTHLSYVKLNGFHDNLKNNS